MSERVRTTKPGTATIRVGIVEDQAEIRDGLTRLIGSDERYRIVGSWESMEEALAGLRREVPDIVLVDIGLPGISGIEGIRILRE